MWLLCFKTLLCVTKKVNDKHFKLAPQLLHEMPLPPLSLVLMFMTPLYLSNTELLVYLITCYEISCPFPYFICLLPPPGVLFFVLNRLVLILQSPAQTVLAFWSHLLLYLEENWSPSLLCYPFTHTRFDYCIFSLQYNHLFTYFPRSLDYEFLEIDILFLFWYTSLGTVPGT